MNALNKFSVKVIKRKTYTVLGFHLITHKVSRRNNRFDQNMSAQTIDTSWFSQQAKSSQNLKINLNIMNIEMVIYKMFVICTIAIIKTSLSIPIHIAVTDQRFQRLSYSLFPHKKKKQFSWLIYLHSRTITTQKRNLAAQMLYEAL